MQNCYKSSKIPNSKSKDQDERLTTKHIQTLSFLQEIVNENKALKARVAELETELEKCSKLHELAENAQDRIKEIQQQYHDRSDQITKMLAEKHQQEMMCKVEEGMETEKKWLTEKHQLLQEIERLKKENSDLRGQLAATIQQKQMINELENKLTTMQTDIDKLIMENKRLEGENRNQIVEIQRLQYVEDKNTKLTDELTEANQTIKELEFRISRMERDSSNVGVAEQEELLATLRVKLHKLHKEKAIWEERDKQYNENIENLQGEISKLRRALSDSERMRGEMHTQLDGLIKEIEALKNRQTNDRDNQAFKDFVKVKREVVQLREENEELRQKVRGKKSAGLLPKIDGEGDGIKSKSKTWKGK